VAADLRALRPSLPLQVISNTVDTQEYSPAAGDGALLDRLAGMTPLQDSCLRVGLIATFARWKGQDVFLQAATRVMRANPACRIRFFIIGGPIYARNGSQYQLAELQSLTRQLGLSEHVGFIGFQKDIVTMYRSLDVVVHASTAPEPFGMTIIEAMACGKPVIATQSGGAAEIFQSGYDALGVPPGKPQALADTMFTLLKNPQLRHNLGQHARNTVCLKFNQDRLGRQIVTAYRELCHSQSTLFTPNIRKLHSSLRSLG
jgi:glycosyltransferase involved in cell wall biosynthesis